MSNLNQQDQTTNFMLHTAPSVAVKVEVLLSNETIWLTQERMAALFFVQRPAITKHVKNIFKSGELQEDMVGSVLEHTTEHDQFDNRQRIETDFDKEIKKRLSRQDKDA